MYETSDFFPGLKDALLSYRLPYISGTAAIPSHYMSLFYKTGRNDARDLNLSKATQEDLELLTQACSPATFGRGQRDVLDESYRKAGKLDRSSFYTPFCPGKAGIIERVEKQLVTRDDLEGVTYELYKLNVYGEQSFFKSHKDTPRSEIMFGSLVVVFPTAHTGGALTLRTDRHEFVCDTADLVLQDQNSVAFVAFYSDVEHEVLPVTSGHRVTLTYNLYYTESKIDASSLIQPVNPTYGDSLQKSLAALLAEPSFLPHGGFLGFGLNHRYIFTKRASLDVMLNRLKGIDDATRRACKSVGLRVRLNLIYNSDTWRENSLMTEEVIDYKDRKIFEMSIYQADDYVFVGEFGQKGNDNHLYRDSNDIVIKEILWVTELGDLMDVETNYIASYNGENESLGILNGNACLVAEVGPFHDRSASLPVPAKIKTRRRRFEPETTDNTLVSTITQKPGTEPALEQRLFSLKETIASAQKPIVYDTCSVSSEYLTLFYRAKDKSFRWVNLADSSADELELLAQSCSPVSSGSNAQSSYHKAGDLDLLNSSMSFCPRRAGIVDRVTAELLSRSKNKAVGLKLHSLSVHDKDSNFESHTEAPQHPDLFGKIVVALSVSHEGGTLILQNGAEEWSCETSFLEPRTAEENRSPTLSFVGFTKDVKHKVTRVSSGYLVLLTYNLFRERYSLTRTRDYDSDVRFLSLFGGEDVFRKQLAQALDNENFLPNGGVLAFGLQHQYPLKPSTDLENLFDRLKGSDAMLANVCTSQELLVSIKVAYKSPFDAEVEEMILTDHVLNVKGQIFESYSELVEKCNAEITEKSERHSPSWFTRDRLGHNAGSFHWVTDAGAHAKVSAEYFAYGNEASFDVMYGDVYLLVRVGPYGDRQGRPEPDGGYR